MRRDIEENTPTTPATATSPRHEEAESPKPLIETPRGRAHSVSRVSSSSSVSKDKRLSVSEMSSPTEVHDTAKVLTHSDAHEPDDSSKQSSESSRAERLSRSDLHDRSSSEDSSTSSSSSSSATKKKKKAKKKKRVKSTRVNAAFLAKLNGIGAQGGFGMSPHKSATKKKEDVTIVRSVRARSARILITSPPQILRVHHRITHITKNYFYSLMMYVYENTQLALRARTQVRESQGSLNQSKGVGRKGW